MLKAERKVLTYSWQIDFASWGLIYGIIYLSEDFSFSPLFYVVIDVRSLASNWGNPRALLLALLLAGIAWLLCSLDKKKGCAAGDYLYPELHKSSSMRCMPAARMRYVFLSCYLLGDRRAPCVRSSSEFTAAPHKSTRTMRKMCSIQSFPAYNRASTQRSFENAQNGSVRTLVELQRTSVTVSELTVFHSPPWLQV